MIYHVQCAWMVKCKKRLPEVVLYSHGGLPGRIVAQESNPAILVSSGDDNHISTSQMSIFNQVCIDLK